MLSIMRPRYYWRGFTKDVLDFVGSCVDCSRAKPSNRKFKQPMCLRDASPAPFHTVIIDALELPVTPNGYKYAILCVDMYSRYICAWPSRTLSASVIGMEFLQNVICQHGCPVQCQSDNGQPFTSEIFTTLTQQFGIKQVFSSAYTPRSQGAVERANRSVLGLLRTMVNSRGNNWHKFLKPVVFALNISDCYFNTLSPFMLVHGRQARFPLSWDIPDLDTRPKTVQDFFSEIIAIQNEADAIVKEISRERQAYQKEYYDRTVKEANLREGDTVYVYWPKREPIPDMKKMAKLFWGPYSVVKFTSEYTCILKEVESGIVLQKSINISRLKKGKLREDVSRWDPIPDDQITDDDSDFTDDDLPSENKGDKVETPVVVYDDPTLAAEQHDGDEHQGHLDADSHDDGIESDSDTDTDHPSQADPDPGQEKPADILDPQNPGKACKCSTSREGLHNLKDILRAEKDASSNLLVCVEFNDGDIRWIPVEYLDPVARNYFEHLDLQIHVGRSLRSRPKRIYLIG